MLTFCDLLHEQNKKHKQTLEGAQCGQEVSFNERSTCFQFDKFYISLFFLDSILFGHRPSIREVLFKRTLLPFSTIIILLVSYDFKIDRLTLIIYSAK